MKFKIYLDEERVSQKKAKELIGEKKFNKRKKDAIETFKMDPYIQSSWMTGIKGYQMLTIEVVQ